MAERKADYRLFRAKKKGGKRRQHAQARAVRRSHKRIQRRRATRHALNRTIAEANMGETNRIICRGSKHLRIPVLPVPAAGTSQTCPRCRHRDLQNRESQAVFQCQRYSFPDNPDFTASRSVRNRDYALYFEPNVTVEKAPTGWPEQPSQRCGQIPLFRIESETKPEYTATAFSDYGGQGQGHQTHDRVQILSLVA